MGLVDIDPIDDGRSGPVARLTAHAPTATLNATKGITVSDSSIPTSPAAYQPPPAPAAPFAPAPPAPPQQADSLSAQPTQAYPGAAPAYPSAPQPYSGSAVQPYGSAAPQPYGATSPGYAASYPAAPQQGGAYPTYPAYAAPSYAAPRPTSGLATTSLICGNAGVVLFWAVIPLIASIVAVITGHMALRQTKANPALGGRGMAIAGLIMGYVMIGLLAIGIIMTIVSFVFVGAFTLPFIFST